MSDWLIVVLIGAACGVLLGIKVARDSRTKETVRGGTGADVFHYLASASMSSTLPFIIAGIVVGLRFVVLFGTAVGFLALTMTWLLLYASIEQNAPAGADEHRVLGE
ncbi:MAG: hypothetical protein GYB65_03290 [Chloroflexi bacterium]|nr:hypothetical protein [Chloroflexota bacterium]